MTSIEKKNCFGTFWFVKLCNLNNELKNFKQCLDRIKEIRNVINKASTERYNLYYKSNFVGIPLNLQGNVTARQILE